MNYLDRQSIFTDEDFRTRVKWAINDVAQEKFSQPNRTDHEYCRGVIREPENQFIITSFVHAVVTNNSSIGDATDEALKAAVDSVWDTISGNQPVTP